MTSVFHFRDGRQVERWFTPRTWPPGTRSSTPRERARSARVGGRVAHLELVNPPLNLFTAELVLHCATRCVRSDGRGRPGGRPERARRARVLRRFARRRVRGSGWRGRPRPTPARPGRVAPAGRAADAEDRGDRGHCLGGGLELALCSTSVWHRRRPGWVSLRSASRSSQAPAGRNGYRESSVDAGQGADPDRARPDCDRGRGHRPGQPRRGSR